MLKKYIIGRDMKNKCENCNHSLYLSDVETNSWHENHEEFVLHCSKCGHDNIVKVPLFDVAGHITDYNLEMIRKELAYLPEPQLTKVKQHFEVCELCKGRFEERHLIEIEDKLEFHRKSLEFFDSNSFEVMQPVVGELIDKKIAIKKFCYHPNGNLAKLTDRYLRDCYDIKDEDEFHRDNGRVVYYLRENIVLTGMASFIMLDGVIYLENIWVRTKLSYEKEKKFFDGLKNRSVQLKLETLEAIFKRVR